MKSFNFRFWLKADVVHVAHLCPPQSIETATERPPIALSAAAATSPGPMHRVGGVESKTENRSINGAMGTEAQAGAGVDRPDAARTHFARRLRTGPLRSARDVLRLNILDAV
jgi:hypothetical protein